MAPPSYKLTYFNARGIVETHRLIFAYAKVSFEDVRIEKDDWPGKKPNFPWGALPVLEVEGKVLSQSGAMLRFLGKKFNLAGENDFEAAKCDEMVEALTDFRTACSKYSYEQDETKKEEIKKALLSETFPKFLGKLNETLSKNNGFLVGKKISYADIALASGLDNLKSKYATVLEKYPALTTHLDTVFNLPGIKEWVAKRPKTEN